MIHIDKNEVAAGVDDRALVAEARRRLGRDDIFSGRARAGELSLSELRRILREVDLVEDALRGDVDGRTADDVTITVADYPDARPLRFLASVWRAMPVTERTRIVGQYWAEQKQRAETAAVKGQIGAWEEGLGVSDRTQAALRRALDTLPTLDKMAFWQIRPKVLEQPDLPKAGLASEREGEGAVIRVNPTVESGNYLVRTLIHELLHITRRHTALARFAYTEQELETLRTVFERQSELLSGELFMDAAPEIELPEYGR